MVYIYKVYLHGDHSGVCVCVRYNSCSWFFLTIVILVYVIVCTQHKYCSWFFSYDYHSGVCHCLYAAQILFMIFSYDCHSGVCNCLYAAQILFMICSYDCHSGVYNCLYTAQILFMIFSYDYHFGVNDNLIVSGKCCKKSFSTFLLKSSFSLMRERQEKNLQFRKWRHSHQHKTFVER